MAEKLFKLINKGKSTYNGVRAGGIAQVSQGNLAFYLNFGFEKVGTTINENNAIDEDDELITIDTYTVKQLKEILEIQENQDKLAALGLAYNNKANKTALYEQYLAVNGASDETESEDGNTDYAKMLTDSGIAYEDADDLKILAEENGLI